MFEAPTTTRFSAARVIGMISVMNLAIEHHHFILPNTSQTCSSTFQGICLCCHWTSKPLIVTPVVSKHITIIINILVFQVFMYFHFYVCLHSSKCNSEAFRKLNIEQVWETFTQAKHPQKNQHVLRPEDLWIINIFNLFACFFKWMTSGSWLVVFQPVHSWILNSFQPDDFFQPDSLWTFNMTNQRVFNFNGSQHVSLRT